MKITATFTQPIDAASLTGRVLLLDPAGQPYCVTSRNPDTGRRG